MKTSELTGAALDWAVEIAEEMTVSQREFQPSTNWSQGGPIIERELIKVWPYDCAPNWKADVSWYGDTFTGTGPTPLIAAMRCYVASRMGDDIEIPAELED